MTQQTYDVIVDEIYPRHGGHNFSYQNHDENFERIESVCEGCVKEASTTHTPSPDLLAQRAERPRTLRPPRMR